MADTAAQFANHPALERPKVTEREPLHWNQLKFGEAPVAGLLGAVQAPSRRGACALVRGELCRWVLVDHALRRCDEGRH